MQCIIGYKPRRGMPAGEGPESCAAVWEGQATGRGCWREQVGVACVIRSCLRDQKGKLMPRFTEACELFGDLAEGVVHAQEEVEPFGVHAQHPAERGAVGAEGTLASAEKHFTGATLAEKRASVQV